MCALGALIDGAAAFSNIKIGAISFAMGICLVAAIHVVSLIVAVLWKYLLGVKLIEGFHRTLTAVYFLPLSVAVIFIAVASISLLINIST